MKHINISDIIQTGFIILSIGLAGWYLKSDITADISKEIKELRQELKQEIKEEISGLEKRINERFEQVDKRFDRIEKRFDRIEQNHLEHITNIHLEQDKH